jgi:hypothetical protein
MIFSRAEGGNSQREIGHAAAAAIAAEGISAAAGKYCVPRRNFAASPKVMSTVQVELLKLSNQESSWISARAYALWEAAGRPVGRDQEHWHQAVVEYQFKERTKASHDGEEVLSRRRASVPSVAISKSSIRTVLVVEDEPRLRFDTVDMLESAGYTTLEAANADEALVLLRTARSIPS